MSTPVEIAYRRTRTYVAHPVGNDPIQRLINLDAAQKALDFLTKAMPDIEFVAPWIQFCQNWDESYRVEGFELNQETLENCDAIVLVGTHLSAGMARELKQIWDQGGGVYRYAPASATGEDHRFTLMLEPGWPRTFSTLPYVKHANQILTDLCKSDDHLKTLLKEESHVVRTEDDGYSRIHSPTMLRFVALLELMNVWQEIQIHFRGEHSPSQHVRVFNDQGELLSEQVPVYEKKTASEALRVAQS